MTSAQQLTHRDALSGLDTTLQSLTLNLLKDMSQIPTSIQSIGYLFSVLIRDHCQQLNIGFRRLPSKRASRASLATEWEKQMYLCKSK